MEKKPLVFAYYVTGHGFGHATRVLELLVWILGIASMAYNGNRGQDFVSSVAFSHFILTWKGFSNDAFFIDIFLLVLLDCGAVQADALTVDRLASLEKYVQAAVVPRDSILATEVEWLKSINANLVASDAVPIACRAAADAGIRAVCVTNFSWDFIYAEYVMVAGRQSHSIIWQIAEDYSHCDFLIRLPGYCPMPAFSDVVDAPLVVRKLHKSRAEVRKELGIEEDAKVLIYNFGGQPAGWKLEKEYLPDGWICLVCGASDEHELPENFVKLPKDVYTPDLIAASDCMLGKIGYGTASEALAYKVPLIFVRRDYFNEEPFVRNMLEVVAQILRDTAFGKDPTPSKLQGSFGKDIDVPHWYTLAQTELSSRTPLPDENSIQNTASAIGTEDFEILHGDHHGLSDTIGFLKSLTDLHALSNNENSSKHQSRESLAAAAMINWEEEIVVARAPGRLDVMGGIADYSGSLVLQMPIREACHVAIQRCRPEKQKLWKHAQARQQNKGDGSTPVLQIVSFGSELSNRAPTFDMDLSDFLEDGKPISYEKARLYFAQDPSQKWAAYVAGTILVLMTELSVQFQDGISILVSSGVPEGKGVSSSAAIEVATMSAVAASHGLNIAPRDLALLCQKVENHVVGAPCGVMDQMASACGEENKLLAMLCQPAEVLGHVEIPSHIRFWGIDSGIRHSVGGADYGSVRIGTFMGRKMIKSMASKQLSSAPNHNSMKVEGVNNDETDEHGKELIQAEAALDYLCNLSPHRYESYVHRLPEFLPGNEFIENYVHHDDSITNIDKKCSYAVRAPTRHPIYENFRVKAFKALLSAAPSDDQLSALGELMYQCHYSYSACGLGSDGTDKLVGLVQQKQHSKSTGGTLFGAKITGGGSGGTVCVIGKNLFRSSEQIFKVISKLSCVIDSSASMKKNITIHFLFKNVGSVKKVLHVQIQQKYKATTGFLPFVFEGSSPGAGKFGYLKIRMRSRSA
ncbi:UNVERIFIED_CONTAM: L-arabinokinase [Sesamum radiatum]|uniref:L-arabinokinase n=1 Tax=Sesamum radiatum TaxID=300843 RepID=A0AAW2LA01_SESRA